MSSWSRNESFRNDYEKRLLHSLDGRQMSKGGPSRNPDEKPLVAVKNPIRPEPEAVAKNQPKNDNKEEPKSAPQKEATPAQKAEKEAMKKATEPEIVSEVVGSAAMVNTGSKISAKEPELESQVDPEKLKQMKREE